MSLDKQKILNELGSVVNQLQSAKCGCMNNLFENQNASPNLINQVTPNPSSAGCRRNCYQNSSCCHNHNGSAQTPSNYCNSNYGNCCTGYNTHNTTPSCAGDNCLMTNNPNPPTNSNNINPVKLYTDTYNYLNKNLVQPTIEEVYNDLKTITPENTVINNPLAQKMGITFQNQTQNYMGNGRNQICNMNDAQINNDNRQLGMGPNIVNMMTTDNSNSNKNADPIVAHSSEPYESIRNSNVKVQPLANSNNPQESTVQQVAAVTNFPIPTPNQQMAGHNYGHSPGHPVEKFNQMFPEIKNKFGDLGYDPMAIAIQMKTESAKQENMQKISQIQNTPETHNNAENVNTNNLTPKNQQQMYNNNQNTNSHGQRIEETIMKQVDNSNIKEESQILNNNSRQCYNTLGQPVEILPADIYRLPRVTLPQTLSPIPVPMGEIVRQNQMNASNYNNVKSTVSKTSLMGQTSTKNKNNSQLQHLYNQYRGSQSYTHQNIQPQIQKSTISEGKIYENKDNNIEVARNITTKPMEQAAGDTLMNNANAMDNNNIITTEKPIIRYTDQKIGSIRGRNGLQDVSFTSYPTTTSWSFHGGYNRPLSPKYYGGRF